MATATTSLFTWRISRSRLVGSFFLVRRNCFGPCEICRWRGGKGCAEVPGVDESSTIRVNTADDDDAALQGVFEQVNTFTRETRQLDGPSSVAGVRVPQRNHHTGRGSDGFAV